MTMTETPTTTTPPTTIVRHREDGDATWFLNSLVTTKASRAETGGTYCLMEHLLTAAANPPMHVQTDEEEAFYVLEGEIEFEVDGVQAHTGPGSFAFVPRGAVHTFRVLSPTARMLVIASSPAEAPGGGLHRFFRTAGTPAGARVLPVPEAPDPVVLTSLAADHGIEILPPPGPERPNARGRARAGRERPATAPVSAPPARPPPHDGGRLP